MRSRYPLTFLFWFFLFFCFSEKARAHVFIWMDGVGGCHPRERAAIPVKGAVYLLAHEVHVEARKPCPCTTLWMHMHVWAETSKEPPIPGVKTIKIETGKHPEPKWRKNSKWEKYHMKKIITAESSLQLLEQDFPGCKCQQKHNPPALS